MVLQMFRRLERNGDDIDCTRYRMERYSLKLRTKSTGYVDSYPVVPGVVVTTWRGNVKGYQIC
jgi:hypothetical protein